MGQHRPAHNVADRIDARLSGAAIAVHRDKSPLINRQANLIKLQVLSVGNAPNRNNEPVAIESLGLSVAIGIGDLGTLGRGLNLADFYAEVNMKA